METVDAEELGETKKGKGKSKAAAPAAPKVATGKSSIMGFFGKK